MGSIAKNRQIKQPSKGVRPNYKNGQWCYERRVSTGKPIPVPRAHAVALVNGGWV